MKQFLFLGEIGVVPFFYFLDHTKAAARCYCGEKVGKTPEQ